MFSDVAGTVPALTTDVTDGFAYVVDVNLDGSTTVTNYIVNSAATPEPASWFLVGIALLGAYSCHLAVKTSITDRHD
jgi:hypothetical protein